MSTDDSRYLTPEGEIKELREWQSQIDALTGDCDDQSQRA